MKDTNPRFNQLLDWLQQPERRLAINTESLQTASSDASFRSYYRAMTQGNEAHSVIIMDAPPQRENNAAFIDNQQRLSKVGLKVPQILDADLEMGFLLLSDLGQQNLYHALMDGLDPVATQGMYRIVLDELVRMQQADTQGLPNYTAERMLEELQLFYTYFVDAHCKITLSAEEKQKLDICFAALVQDNASFPQVYVHRDFHSPNLMMPTDQTLQPGLIDFQDAVRGPITYDIASLVMDARYSWDEEQQIDWAVRYWEKARAAQLPVLDNFGDFHRAYEWMSIQRNLRILGVFCRLSQRDQKHHYLDHLPRVLKYLRQVIQRYEFFNPLRALLDRIENKQTVLGLTF
ncbi:MAG TPA: phosphotransferase [Paenalcaligenes sp.]|nr:phosphotransferase [Paenalcaligenes sp.]